MFSWWLPKERGISKARKIEWRYFCLYFLIIEFRLRFFFLPLIDFHMQWNRSTNTKQIFSAQICAAQKTAKRSNFSIFIAHAWSHEPVIATYLNKFITNTLLRGLKIARQTFFGDFDFAVKFANRLHLRFLIAQFAIESKSMCRSCRRTELWQFIKAHKRITNFSESFRIFVDESTRIRSRKDQQTPTAPRAKVQ